MGDWGLTQQPFSSRTDGRVHTMSGSQGVGVGVGQQEPPCLSESSYPSSAQTCGPDMSTFLQPSENSVSTGQRSQFHWQLSNGVPGLTVSGTQQSAGFGSAGVQDTGVGVGVGELPQASKKTWVQV